jgi:hypothetical protein
MLCKIRPLPIFAGQDMMSIGRLFRGIPAEVSATILLVLLGFLNPLDFGYASVNFNESDRRIKIPVYESTRHH